MARKFKSMDGNEAAAWVSYAYTEVAGIYPITPSIDLNLRAISSPSVEVTRGLDEKSRLRHLGGCPSTRNHPVATSPIARG